VKVVWCHFSNAFKTKGTTVDVDLFIKKMPHVVKELISREAFDNRRSINQEAIALLEEALIHRVGAPVGRRKTMEALLGGYADSGPGNHGQGTSPTSSPSTLS
jgi:Arc-like DNA binding domain